MNYSSNDNQSSLNIARLYNLYRDPTSKLFLNTNVKQIYAACKRDSTLNQVTYDDIYRFKNSIETLSRLKERNILRGRPRYLSFRKWKTNGPLNICLGDLCFLRDIQGYNEGKHTILVLQDAFSRIAFAKLLNNNSSKEVTRHFADALNFFGGTFLKFCCDRGQQKKKFFLLILIIYTFNLSSFFFLIRGPGGEFKKDFKTELDKRNIILYHTNSSIWPKISLVERLILSLKR